MNLLFYLGTVLVVTAIIPANGIIWLYRRVPWKRSVLGRIMFSLSLAIALVLDFSLFAALLLIFDIGRPAWFEAVRLLVFAAVSVNLWLLWWEYQVILKNAREIPQTSQNTDSF